MVMTSGIRIPINLTPKRVLKSKSLLNNAICMLEKADRGMQMHDTVITRPFPSHPTMRAIGEEKAAMNSQMAKDITRFDQNATSVDLYLSSSFSNSC